MKRVFLRTCLAALTLSSVGIGPALGQNHGILDRIKAGRHRDVKDHFHTKEVHHGPPYDLRQIAQMVDILEEGILDDGTIVIKHPDIWGQARMTKYRRDFERIMEGDLGSFAAVLSARVIRSDQASFENATMISTALAGQARVRGPRIVSPGQPPSFAAPVADASAETIKAQAELLKAQNDTIRTQNEAAKAQNEAIKEQNAAVVNLLKEQILERNTMIDKNLSLLATTSDSPINRTTPFNLLPNKPTGSISDKLDAGKIGLDPSIYLDEKKRYLDHLNQIRRINIGDDNADTAGYALYLVRMPVSIQPGEKTKKGHGASLSLSVSHDFGPKFLPQTYRNLLIADLVDQLAPVVFEMLELFPKEIDTLIDSPLKLADLEREIAALDSAEADANREEREATQELANLDEGFKKIEEFLKPNSNSVAGDTRYLLELQSEYPNMFRLDSTFRLEEYRANVESQLNRVETAGRTKQIVADERERISIEKKRLLAASANLAKSIKDSEGQISKANSTSNRFGSRPYPISPTMMKDVFLAENLASLAVSARRTQSTKLPRATDIRSFLERELSTAYELIPQVVQYQEMVERIADSIQGRQFKQLPGHFETVVAGLPGDLMGDRKNPTAILFYAIAVDAGLLNRRLREDMKSIEGQQGFQPTCDIESAFFYLAEPEPGATATFEDYIKARWPIITFALDPTTDQQNIADAASLRRDLQIAVALAFSAGRINFNQMNRFRRRIEEDAETIALNRTVTAFAHGNDAFGWRFSPRFQNPPVRESNLKALGNMLYRGGPPADIRTRESLLEAGQRELTAILIMPSFLQRARFEVAGNWFPLANPDDLVVPTARMIWQGQRLMELRHAVTHFCDPKQYRPGDVERVLARIDRVEASLPIQTEFINVPYENTQGGFDLFTPGLSSLAPELLGYEGLSEIREGKDASLLLYAKNISIHETAIVAGGMPLKDENNVQILSREVVRISIPASVLSTLRKGSDRPYVEIHMATPNGISNRLLVPFSPTATPDVEKPTVSPSSFGWENPAVVTAYLQFRQDGTLGNNDILFESKPTMKLKFSSDMPSLKIPTELNQLAFRLKMKDEQGKSASEDTDTLATPNRHFEKGTVSIAFNETIEDGLKAAIKKITRSRFSGTITVDVQTAIQVDNSEIPFYVENTWTLNLVPQPVPDSDIKPDTETTVPAPVFVPAPPGVNSPLSAPFDFDGPVLQGPNP